MFELFANPANMIIGGALISSPIIIHLINRMRFKRIRWAAMEFLLKSQKRNRRRLIIEQLILLLLRINEETTKKLSDVLRDMEGCTKLHLDLIRGIKAAEEMLGRHAVDQRSLYLVSDFRQKHWSEPEATELRKHIEGLTAAGVKVHL